MSTATTSQPITQPTASLQTTSRPTTQPTSIPSPTHPPTPPTGSAPRWPQSSFRSRGSVLGKRSQPTSEPKQQRRFMPTESYSHPADLFWTPRTPLLGPFKNRTEALQAERGWLVTYQHGIALTACKVVPTKDRPQADHAIAGRAARGWKAPSAPTALASRSVLAR